MIFTIPELTRSVFLRDEKYIVFGSFRLGKLVFWTTTLQL